MYTASDKELFQPHKRNARDTKRNTQMVEARTYSETGYKSTAGGVRRRDHERELAEKANSNRKSPQSSFTPGNNFIK
jgi:hypothetical protein